MSEGKYRIISLEHPDGYAVISGEALVDNQICKGCSKRGAELIAATLNAFAGKKLEEYFVISKDEWLYLSQKITSIESENAALKAQLAVAREALEHTRTFIENGAGLGYILMPESDDPACDTLPMVDKALTALDNPEPGGVVLTKGEHEGLLDFISSDCGICKSKELRDVKDFAACVNCGTHLALAILRGKPGKE